MSAPGGGVCSGGVCSEGEGVSALGVSAPGGWEVVSQHALRQTPPVDRITDTSKNITLATTSLRSVKIMLLLVEDHMMKNAELHRCK